MSGNATYRHSNTAVLSVCAIDAPQVVTSAEFDERLGETYRRLGLRAGMLEKLAGIRERRWWPEDVSFVDAAAMAGAKALAEAGTDPSQVGLLIDSSVARTHLEPSAAVAVHHALSLPTSCLNFDLANACLGFVNGMQLAATMIDAGQLDYALVVDGEEPARPSWQRSTGSPARAPPPRTSPPSSPRSPLAPARPAWCWAAPTAIQRATGSSAVSLARGPSTMSCASAICSSCAPTPRAYSRPGSPSR